MIFVKCHCIIVQYKMLHSLHTCTVCHHHTVFYFTLFVQMTLAVGELAMDTQLATAVALISKLY